MKAEQMSGREFLDDTYGKNRNEAMCLQASDGGTYRRRRELDIEDARRGTYQSQMPATPEPDLALETLSAVASLQSAVARQASLIYALERMVQFLVERVPGPVLATAQTDEKS